MKREEWSEHFERQKETDLSVLAYCKQEGLQASSWYYWKRRLKAMRMPMQRCFVQARVVESKVGSSCEIIFPSGVRLKLDETPPVSWLRSLAE